MRCALTGGKILNANGQQGHGPGYIYYDEEDVDPISLTPFSKTTESGICYYRKPIDASAYRTMEYSSMRSLVQANTGDYVLDPETRGRICRSQPLPSEAVQFCIPYLPPGATGGPNMLLQVFRYLRACIDNAHWHISLLSEEEKAHIQQTRTSYAVAVTPPGKPRFLLALRCASREIIVTMWLMPASRTLEIRLPWEAADQLMEHIEDACVRLLLS